MSVGAQYLLLFIVWSRCSDNCAEGIRILLLRSDDRKARLLWSLSKPRIDGHGKMALAVTAREWFAIWSFPFWRCMYCGFAVWLFRRMDRYNRIDGGHLEKSQCLPIKRSPVQHIRFVTVWTLFILLPNVFFCSLTRKTNSFLLNQEWQSLSRICMMPRIGAICQPERFAIFLPLLYKWSSVGTK